MKSKRLKTILVTGGAGYIGSHTCVELFEAGYDVIVVDNLMNSSEISLQRFEEICGRKLLFYHADVCDRFALEGIFSENEVDAVIHFAGLKAVGESVETPLPYYQNNIVSTLTLCEVMAKFDVKEIVFSSSATVYGDQSHLPIKEDCPVLVTNPYGRSKLIIEDILRDISVAEPAWRVVLLRYFNPVGAHPSGLIGEDPVGVPNNLMPYIAQVAVGKLGKLKVFGNDYPTPDGTGVRDYIHVVDLAKGHVKALGVMASSSKVLTVNLGTGRGYSVLEVINSFSKASGRPIPYEIVGRRAGDVSMCCADPGLAKKRLGWSAKYGLDEMCADTWRWQTMNPNGYKL